MDLTFSPLPRSLPVPIWILVQVCISLCQPGKSYSFIVDISPEDYIWQNGAIQVLRLMWSPLAFYTWYLQPFLWHGGQDESGGDGWLIGLPALLNITI